MSYIANLKRAAYTNSNKKKQRRGNHGKDGSFIQRNKKMLTPGE